MAGAAMLARVLSALLTVLIMCMSSYRQLTVVHAWPQPFDDLQDGLSYSFYEESCPPLYEVVERELQHIVSSDPGQAAGLVRIMFHDCFVQGCDASILLKTPSTEQTATPNINSLRTSSLSVIDTLKEAIEEACPGTVSCADIISLAAVKSLAQVGGPDIAIPLGRRDGLTAADNATVIANIPAPVFNFSQLLGNFSSKGLDLIDLVALSGSHTIGRAHCKSVDFQLTPTVSAELAQSYAGELVSACGQPQSQAMSSLQLKVVQMDVETPAAFDEAYYRHVLQGRVPFHSDAALLQDPQAAQLTQLYSQDLAAFFSQFASSLLKMSQIQLLTGSQGEIRLSCSSPNNL